MASTSTLVDRVKIVVLSSGTGPFELGSAVKAYRGVEALSDGTTYNYATENGSTYEVGTGLYIQATGQLVRTPILSSNGGSTVDFPAGVELNFTLLAQDVVSGGGGGIAVVQSPGASTTSVMSQRAVSQGLAAKYDASNPLSFIDATQAAVVARNQLAWTDIYGAVNAPPLPIVYFGSVDQAPSLDNGRPMVRLLRDGSRRMAYLEVQMVSRDVTTGGAFSDTDFIELVGLPFMGDSTEGQMIPIRQNVFPAGSYALLMMDTVSFRNPDDSPIKASTVTGTWSVRFTAFLAADPETWV